MKTEIKVFYKSITLLTMIFFINILNGSFDSCSTTEITGGTFDLSNISPLNSDIILGKNVILTSDNKITVNGYSLILEHDLLIGANETLYLSGDVTIDGQGHNLILGHRSQLLVDTNTTLTLRNLTLNNLSCDL